MKWLFRFEILDCSNFTGAKRFFSWLKAVSLRASFIEGFLDPGGFSWSAR